MTADTPSIRINAGPANPGQFFAGCGLLELADTVSAPVQIDRLREEEKPGVGE